MQLLNSATRNYSWGSRTMIPVLKGEPASDTPVAELWFGAHPGDPSTVDGQRLDEVIAAAPAEQLGKRVQQEEKDVEETLHGAKAWSYPVPIDEFILDRVELCADDTVELNFDGPAIALCTGGEVELRDNEDQELKLQPGQAAWLPAAEETVVTLQVS